jgi:hypothetical protein
MAQPPGTEASVQKLCCVDEKIPASLSGNVVRGTAMECTVRSELSLRKQSHRQTKRVLSMICQRLAEAARVPVW